MWFEVFAGGNISNIWIERAQNILNAEKNIAGSVATVDDEDFVANFETQFITSRKNFEISILGSKEIIQSILKKENMALFRNGKVIIHLICVACVKVSVESVVEILVSRYEKLFDSSRQPTEQHSVFTTTYRTTFFGQSHHFWEKTFPTSCWWNTRKSNEPLLERQSSMVNGTFCAELTTYIHIPETGESSWTESLNYHSCKTVRLRYDIF